MEAFETNAAIVSWIESDIVRIRLKKDAHFSPQSLWEIREEILKRTPNMKYYVVLEAEEHFRIDKETRETAASEEWANWTLAGALVSQKLAHKILGELYISVNKPIRPTRFFKHAEEGIAWLRELKDKNK